MWVRLEVMGHIRILARPHNAVRAALQASCWLLDLIAADESPRKESVQFSKMTFSTSDCYSENRGVRMSIACCSLVHRLDLPGPHSHFSHPCKYQHKPNIEMWSRML